MNLTFRELGPDTWGDFEALFARHGGVWGGCWCAYYHLDLPDSQWRRRSGEENRREKERRVRAGSAHGVLAYRDGEPVGSCQLGPPEDLPKVERRRAYAGLLARIIHERPCCKRASARPAGRPRGSGLATCCASTPQPLAPAGARHCGHLRAFATGLHE